MFIVSYYDYQGRVCNQKMPTYTKAESFAAHKAMKPEATPIIILDADGVIIRHIVR